MQPLCFLQYLTQFISAFFELLRTFFDDDIALFGSVVAVFVCREVEVEVGAAFEESFFRGVTLAERFLKTFVPIAFRFEFRLFENHVKGVQVMFQFEIDSPFGGWEDDGNLVFGPWDFIDVSSILLLANMNG